MVRARPFHGRGYCPHKGAWWPLATHHIAEKDAETAIIEPRVGGRWFERATDGTECLWGKVLVWEPPSRLVLAWQISGEWAYDADLLTEVEVSFLPEGEGHTRVELEHRGLDAFGEKMDEVRRSIDSPGGWPGILERFGQLVTAA